VEASIRGQYREFQRIVIVTYALFSIISCNSETDTPDDAVALEYPARGSLCAATQVSDSGETSVLVDIDNTDLSCSDIVIIDDPLIGVSPLPSTGIGTVQFDSEVLRPRAVLATYDVTNRSMYTGHSAVSLLLHDGEARLRKLDLINRAEDITLHPIIWGLYSSSFFIELDLGSESVSHFQGGIFEFSDITRDFEPVPGESFLGFGSVWLDGDGNGRIDDSDKTDYALAGRVTISGERPNLVVNIDLVLEGGGSLKGSFSGDYIYIPDFVLQN